MNSLKVAWLQILPQDDLNGNLQTGYDNCEKEKDIGTDMVMLPDTLIVETGEREGMYLAGFFDKIRQTDAEKSLTMLIDTLDSRTASG